MTIATYITDNFPTIKLQLGWNDSTQIVTIVAKTLELYGVATEAEATDLTKAHALADVAVWRQALTDISLDYSFSADGASFSRNQAVDNISKMLTYAETVAIPYMSAYNIVVHAEDRNADWIT
jgi:hypothetical protein